MHLYKLTSQVSLVTALIEQDHFLYLSSFMNKYFSGNVFKFLIFFNLLTFNKRVLNFAGSLAWSESHPCSVLWLAVRRWCHTFMCTRSINSESSLSWQRKLMISFMVPTKPDWTGLVLSTQNLSYNPEFVHLPSCGEDEGDCRWLQESALSACSSDHQWCDRGESEQHQVPGCTHHRGPLLDQQHCSTSQESTTASLLPPQTKKSQSPGPHHVHLLQRHHREHSD